MNGQAGKGDSYRTVDRKKWSEGWDRAFGKDQPLQTWYACEKHKCGMNYRNPCPECEAEKAKATQ